MSYISLWTCCCMSSYLSRWFSVAAVAGYAVTFYLTNYNEIHYGDSVSYDMHDEPYTIAIVECGLCVATALLAVIVYAGLQSKKVLFALSMYFGVVSVAFGVFVLLRASSLGLLGGDSSVCSDTSLSGCPTTRYESLNEDIGFLSPSGGDCQFWFWGPDMKARYSGPQACNGYGESNGACGPLIENYMDWTKASSYGWRDDPSDVASASQGHVATIDKIHNMKYLFNLQSAIGNVSIPAAYTYSKQPSISSCWYWGCSELCHPYRFRVNRWWLVSSVSMFVVHFLCTVLSIVKWRQSGPDDASNYEKVKSAASQAVEDVERAESFVVPEIGRRKRRLVQFQNPNQLQF